jgi:integrase
LNAVLAVAVGASASEAGADVTARLTDSIDPDFLAVMGWDPQRRVLTFPRDHPVLGWQECLVRGCTTEARSTQQLCRGCQVRWTATPGSLEEFVATVRVRRRVTGVGSCAVPHCARGWRTACLALCQTHDHQRRKVLQLPMAEFIAHPDVVALPALGPCQVASCTRDRQGRSYCQAHKQRRWQLMRIDPGFDEAAWQVTEAAIAEGHLVSLRGLPDLVVAETLFGLQQRTAAGIQTWASDARGMTDAVRSQRLPTVTELTDTGMSAAQRRFARSAATSVRRLMLSPETERAKDEWDAAVFGHGGTITFTAISQLWLREATKRWAFDDLPRRRGRSVANAVRTLVNAVAKLSESLRLQRADGGNDPAALSRSDITAFCNRLAFLTSEGAISPTSRVSLCRGVKLVLDRMRSLGLTRPGQPMHRLPDDFALSTADIPDRPEDQEAGKDLPVEVMRQLCQNLPLLEQVAGREVRVATELVIDTGRRPDEICRLGLDCLERDGDGKPVLVYDNHKGHRTGRRLPVSEATAGVIVAQQQRVRAKFRLMPTEHLTLLPSTVANPFGRKAIGAGTVSERHREWVTGLPEFLVAATVHVDGRPATKQLTFDKAKIFLYAYRHTYAQRHADAGVPVDVLQQLMDHRQLDTTQRYYRVGEERRREAVDRVTAMQFDRHGNRIWRHAEALLDSERLRRGVAEVAVPYGMCTEPSNVAAGGKDCPVRFRCVGCGHFRTDVSYLPDLEAYLADLLRNRERLLAALDADDWAKAEAMPSDEEIRRLRRLIDRVRQDVDGLTAQDRAQIEQAVAVVRRGRTILLGVPRARPLTDLRGAHAQ